MMNQIKLLFSFVGCLFSMISVAQTIDYNLIQKNIEDKNSAFYYPNLLERFEAADSTLSVEDFRHLYYGFTFQEGYRPYDRNPLDVKISDQLGGATTEEDFLLLKGLSLEYLEQDPFSLKIINYLQNFNYSLPDTEAENEKLQFQYNGIIKAIASTGDGQSIKTAYTVNHPSDEYMFMRYLQVKPSSSKFETAYDLYQLAENERGLNEVYFDIYRMAIVGTAQIGLQTVEVEEEKVEIPENGILVGSKEEVNEFIEGGRMILVQEAKDLDGDGDIDWLIVSTQESEKLTSNYAGGHPIKRELMILTRGENGLLSPTLKTNNAVPCIDCGGTATDPFVGISFSDDAKTMTISSKGGDLFIWERDSVFEQKAGKWMLIKEEFSSYRKGKEEKKNTDVETQEDFGEISLAEFDYYKNLE